MLKKSIHQEDETIVNIYAPNIGTLKCKSSYQQTKRRHKQHIIVGNLNNPLSTIERSDRIDKKTADLNNTTEQTRHTRHIHYIMFHPKAAECTFSPNIPMEYP